MASRREFLQGLVASGAPVRQRPTHKKHSTGTRIYLGPMTIPQDVADAVAIDPGLYKAKGSKLRSRYAQRERNGIGSAAVYVFAAAIPAHRGMVGEIVLDKGHYGVHCWTAADPGAYDEPLAIAARKRNNWCCPSTGAAIDHPPADHAKDCDCAHFLPRPLIKAAPIMPPPLWEDQGNA